MDEKQNKKTNVLNALTIDVEDWFHVSVFRNAIDYQSWATQESRILPNICRILKLFKEHNVTATFMILGWLAEQYPEIVLTIKKYGHEIGSHSYSHRLIYEMSPAEFSKDLNRSLTILESIVQEEIKIFRAPSWSITRDSLWALQHLVDQGIRYDSSIFPVKHDIYGMTGFPRFPFCFNFTSGQTLIEFPPSTVQLYHHNVPIAGGGYLRLFPFWFIKRGIRKLNMEGRPALLYFHPWELDPYLPRFDLKFTSRFRHYSNLDITEKRVKSLLDEFRFASISQVLESCNVPPWPSMAEMQMQS